MMCFIRRGFYAVVIALGLALGLVWGLARPGYGMETLVPSPAYPVQTFQTEDYSVRVETITSRLRFPWAMDFLPDGSAVVTEKPGTMRHLSGNKLSKPFAGVPEVKYAGQGGLLDVAVDPDFAKNQLIFFSYAEPAEEGRLAGTAVARARLILGEAPRLEDVHVIFRMNRKTDKTHHYGSRITIAPDGTLFVTLGDRGEWDRAQDPFDHAGAVIRINKDGSIPADNPFADGRQAAPEIWSIGHRNAQGAAWNKGAGMLWTVAHGARGGDEINEPRAGRNYGWPVITYGRNYNGEKIGIGTHKEGMEQPLYYWDPSIAPSGMAYYDGAAFPRWRGNIFVGALKDEMLVRLEFREDKVVKEERLLQGQYGRIRDVVQGPDGYIYFLTDEKRGKVLRLRPAS
tara:strand:+ start:8796 stop:9992 length:1197 start_codon:yes stop_codon:yes gene_type:complete